ncbi:MAG: VOC family protein [Labilithrix sp.]|nr:VOC family protein [Labilithrix sp.]
MRIHHLALRTGDLGRLERFYVEAIGLAVVRRQGDRSVWLEAGGAIVMLERRDADEPGIAPGTKELVAFAIEPGARRDAMRRLERAGVPVDAETPYTIYARDPDGRRIGLSSYPDAGETA